jgi:hypothetical protein
MAKTFAFINFPRLQKNPPGCLIQLSADVRCTLYERAPTLVYYRTNEQFAFDAWQLPMPLWSFCTGNGTVCHHSFDISQFWLRNLGIEWGGGAQPWFDLSGKIKMISFNTDKLRNILFRSIGFKWSWHVQVQLNTDLLRQREEYLYMNKCIDAIVDQKELLKVNAG